MKLMKIFFTFMLIFTISACTGEENTRNDGEKMMLEGTAIDVNDQTFLMDSNEGFVVVKKGNITFGNGVNEEINIGNYVKLEFRGMLLESHPMQIEAETITILKNEIQQFPLGLLGYFNENDVVTVNRLDNKNVILYSREFDLCAQALEKVYEDEDGTYYLSCISSENYAVYNDGKFMSLVDAFESGVIHPNDVKDYINIYDETEAVSK